MLELDGKIIEFRVTHGEARDVYLSVRREGSKEEEVKEEEKGASGGSGGSKSGGSTAVSGPFCVSVPNSTFIACHPTSWRQASPPPSLFHAPCPHTTPRRERLVESVVKKRKARHH